MQFNISPPTTRWNVGGQVGPTEKRLQRGCGWGELGRAGSRGCSVGSLWCQGEGREPTDGAAGRLLVWQSLAGAGTSCRGCPVQAPSCQRALPLWKRALTAFLHHGMLKNQELLPSPFPLSERKQKQNRSRIRSTVPVVQLFHGENLIYPPIV